MTQKLRVKIEPEKVEYGIRWLEIQEAEGGFYLFQHEDISSPCKWDSFYSSLDEVLEDCLHSWGIEHSDWVTVS